MKKIIVFAGVMGMLFVAGANAGPQGPQLATTNTVSGEVTTAGSYVTAVETAATTDAGTNTTNGTTITNMQSDRQGLADDGPCGNYDTAKYSGCGYISADGTTGEKEWVKIRKAI